MPADADESASDKPGERPEPPEGSEAPMTAGCAAASLGVVAVLLSVGGQVWARRSTGYGSLVPTLGGWALGLLAGLVGLVGIIIMLLRRRSTTTFPHARAAVVLLLVGVAVGLVAVSVFFR